MKYKHLDIAERETIQQMLWNKQSVRDIARVVGRSPSSISREIKKNKPLLHNVYTPRLAHERALKKRTSRGREDRLKSDDIRMYVVTHLKKGWSPEQISGSIEQHINQGISHEAIYQYIYHQIYRNGWGNVRPGAEDLRPYLRRKQKRRQHKGMRKSQRIFRLLGRSIDTRPKVVEQRKRIGDWEGDTVESKDHLPGINTLVDRKTGYVLITKLENKTSGATARAMQRLHAFPCHTVTLDNGPENRDWQTLEMTLNTQVYYAHPYHSWERGTNENTNGLIREYFPKKTDFTLVSDEDIRHVEYILNTRPRKRLGYKTPLQVMSVALES